MPLPICKCPVCHTIMSIDVLLADDAPRDALLAIVDIHPQGDSFIKPLLRYVSLFAPIRSQMSHSRIATLINEIAPMVKAGKIERNGILHSAPLDYWIDAINAVLAARDAGTLTLPMKSHGYLFEVIAKRSMAAAAKSDQLREDQAKRGEQIRRQQISMAGHVDQPTDKAQAREKLAKLRQKLPSKTGVSSLSEIATHLIPQPKEPS